MTITLVKSKPPLQCSFCGKSEDEVADLVGGVNAFICDVCCEVAAQAIKDQKIARLRVTIDN